MEAARRFDPERNVKFITYAVWWIRQAMTHALSAQTRAFSLPQKALRRRPRGSTREVAELTEQLERTPTSSEIAADTEMSEADVDALMRLGARDVSLSDRARRRRRRRAVRSSASLIEQVAVAADRRRRCCASRWSTRVRGALARARRQGAGNRRAALRSRSRWRDAHAAGDRRDARTSRASASGRSKRARRRSCVDRNVRASCGVT